MNTGKKPNQSPLSELSVRARAALVNEYSFGLSARSNHLYSEMPDDAYYQVEFNPSAAKLSDEDVYSIICRDGLDFKRILRMPNVGRVSIQELRDFCAARSIRVFDDEKRPQPPGLKKRRLAVVIDVLEANKGKPHEEIAEKIVDAIHNIQPLNPPATLKYRRPIT